MVALLCAALTSAGPAPETHTVIIKDLAFSPASLTIAPGDTVRWSNEDNRDHTVVASDGSFSSGNIAPGDSYSFRFRTKGDFAYACSLHPRMKGSVTVSDR
jgi:plastocyanin